MKPHIQKILNILIESDIVEGKVVIPSGDFGFNSQRPRYFVYCSDCGNTVHHNTTGPDQMIEMHKCGE